MLTGSIQSIFNIMATKIYSIPQAQSEKHILRITVDGKSKMILFEDKRKTGNLVYATNSKEEQTEIEKSKLFVAGIMIKDDGNASYDDNTDEDFEAKEYPLVKTWKDAKAVLMEEPYEIKASKLKNAESILAAAESVKASFPNIPAEQ